MIRLTVLYNLPPGSDEEVFLRWRLGEHQESNVSMPGVARTDFSRSYDSWPEGTKPAYRFMTTVDWPDRESFEKAFYDPDEQAKLRESLNQVAEHAFIISEILITEEIS